MLCHSHSEKVFPDVLWGHCLWFCHLAPLKWAWLCSLSTLPPCKPFSKSLLMLPNFPKSCVKFSCCSYIDCITFLLQNRAYLSRITFTAKATQATDASALPRKPLRLLNGHLIFLLLHRLGPFYYYAFFFPSDPIICLSWHRKLLKSTEELQQNS